MNTHCTTRWGVVTGVTFWQNREGVNSDYIGREVVDPVFNYDGKPFDYRLVGLPCRYSDSVFASYVNESTSGRGYLPYMSGPPNTLVYVGQYPVTNNVRDPFAGEEVWKIGAASGESRAKLGIGRTCVNTRPAGVNLYLLCQSLADAAPGYTAAVGGDSGSPVFAKVREGAAPRGLLWGASNGGRTFAFSPIGGLTRDLGPLDFTP